MLIGSHNPTSIIIRDNNGRYMGQAQGLIADILAIVDSCELCGTPAISGNTFEIYTIEAFDPADFSSLFKNIVVLCPDCKAKFDDSTISRKHLKACVRLREPELTRSLQDLLGRYDLPGTEQKAGKKLSGSLLDKLVNDPAYFERLVFVAGILVVILGIFLFAFGYQNSIAYDTDIASAVEGSGSPFHMLLYPFLEIAGIVLALLGMFFELGLVKKPSA